VILSYSPSQILTSEEKDVIWKFRFYLARDKKGLTKFLKSVAWRDSSEVKQAVEELLPQWTEIDTDDALELLGPGTVDSRVRAFAVKQLSRADDEVRVLLSRRLVTYGFVRSFFSTFYNWFKRSSLRVLQPSRGLQDPQQQLSRTRTVVFLTSLLQEGS